MAETFYQKYFKPLPPLAKGIIGITVVGVVTYVGFSVYKSIKRRKELKEANKAGIAAEKELIDLDRKGIRPTMSESQFETLSENLVQAMNGCGTDNGMVRNVFKKIKNDADIRKLISIFGVRFYQPCAADQPISYSIYLFNDKAFGGGLPTWIAYDLDSDEIEEVNGILRGNGVNYEF